MTEVPTTLHRTLRPGPVKNAGSEGAYRRLVYGPGEPRSVRDDLMEGATPSGQALQSLLRLGHLTDPQIADVQSPGRFEFFEQLRGAPGAEFYVPACRPQEALVAQAVAVMVGTLNGLGQSPETGAWLGLALSTGDSLDNAQFNELQWFLALLSGGTVETNSGGPLYEGVQADGWEPALYWRPGPAPDPFKQRFGFPACPGLLEGAVRPFISPGLQVPWLSCFGNHDGLVLGTSVPTPEYEKILSGGQKAFDVPPGPGPLSEVGTFLSHPDRMLAGPRRPVAADPRRRSIGRKEFVQAHLQAAGTPHGHGFGPVNLASGTAYGVYDIDGPVPLRVVMLDTTNMDGDFQGSIGARQARWLEDRLSEVHARHFGPDGRVLTTGAADRLVVLASHHGLDTMTNDRHWPGGREDDHPRVTARALEAMLHRFGNIVLWLNGHRHLNDVQPRPDPTGRTGGFWEVSTASMADWPCQSRVVELVSNGDDEVSILCTMVDGSAPADPEGAEGLEHLASLHRELASNHPFAGAGGGTEGKPADRNVALRIACPFVLG